MQIRELKLEVTQECPLRCVHCSSNSSREAQNIIPLMSLKRIIGEGMKLGVQEVALSGGEPLVHPDLYEVVSQCTRWGLKSKLYTSGIVDNDLTPLSLEQVERLRDLGLGKIIFSIYSHRRKVHNSITAHQTFDATLSALKVAARTIPTEIHFVPMRSNFRDLPGVLELARSVAVEKVSLLRFVPQGRGALIAEKEMMTFAEYGELRSIIHSQKDQSVVVRIGAPLNFLELGWARCNAATDVVAIDFRGQIFPCEAFKNFRWPSEEPNVLNVALETALERSTFLSAVRDNVRQDGACLAQRLVRLGTVKAGPDPDSLEESTELVTIGANAKKI